MATDALRVRVEGAATAPLLGWEMARQPAGGPAEPHALAAIAAEWLPVELPTTAAAALAALGRWSATDEVDFDASDWWFRCRFAAGPASGAERLLRFGGLATVADVWLNGTLLLHSANMFLTHECDVTAALRDDNELLIRCRALGPLLEGRRPRPRWRTRLVQSQALRWFRTTLLGRMPGWSPPAAPVGPWRPVTLSEAAPLAVDAADVRARLDGAAGVVAVSLRVRPAAGQVERAALVVDGVTVPLALRADGDGTLLSGELRIDSPALWWPHTHGAQPRYAVRVTVHTAAGDATVDCGRVGFRSLRLDTAGGQFALSVNGAPVFCRGACWTPLDVIRLSAAGGGISRGARAGARRRHEHAPRRRHDGLRGRRLLRPLRRARHPGLAGLHVRQHGLPGRRRRLRRRPSRAEVDAAARRLQARPSLAVLCGGSEVEQQAAMLGLPAGALGRARSSTRCCPSSCGRARAGRALRGRASPAAARCRSTSNQGARHYYGVGAYLRPLEDARRAEVRFAIECLAFANVPDAAVVEALLGGPSRPSDHPRWKARVPRDAGAGWDFEDVRDHYVARLFGVDPGRAALRAIMERYLALGRVATGEVMAATFAEWRRARSTCRGGAGLVPARSLARRRLGRRRFARRAQGGVLLSAPRHRSRSGSSPPTRASTGSRSTW